jgi:aryl-alcohol dehydrogenase-like predicted oxidoreductase
LERIELAPGLTISRVITGLWQVADMERDGRAVDIDAAADAMVPYVDAGFTTFDMADHYGSAEDIVGRFGRRHPGRRVELFTKWVPTPGPVAPEAVADAIQRSRDRMQVDCIDLLQFHVWNYADPSWLDCLTHLVALRDRGVIRHIGLTNVDTAHLHMVLRSGFPIVSNQVSFSLLDRRAGHGMSELCRANGVGLLAFGTVAGGFLSERWLGRPDPGLTSLQTWSQMKYRRYIDQVGGWDAFQRLLRRLSDVSRTWPAAGCWIRPGSVQLS